jgi:DNA topoisomerase-6 subunit A
MAKKATSGGTKTARDTGGRTNARVKARDAETQSKIVTLADNVAKRALSGAEPVITVPTRTKSNTEWNAKKGILQMGKGAQERQLFNLSQAKSFMQTMLHGRASRT